MTQIRASMQQKLKLKEIDKEACKFKTVNVASTILTGSSDDECNTPNVTDCESSDEGDDMNQNSGNMQNINDWRNMISRWINMLENDSDLIELENNNVDDDDYDDDYEDDITVANISNLPHPSIDKNAKWKLQDIFNEGLEAPSYFNNN